MDLVQQTKNEISEIEIWKPVIRNNKIVPHYFISNFGRIKSFKKNKEKFLKIQNRVYEERGNCQDIRLAIHKDWFAESTFKPKSQKGRPNMLYCSVTIHRLVIEAFKPIDEYPPIPKSDWEKTPESAKHIIRKSCLVDHIDDNPFNNHVDNLRWVTAEENNVYIKKQIFTKKEEVC